MSPKLVAMTHLMPMAFNDHTALSRELPHPKFCAARRIGAPRKGFWLSTKDGSSSPSGR
jgi:hypothetical protein